ncbi:MAG: hypothetical protein ACKOWW_07715 [Flavobacteriales bacterium]
MSTIKVTKATTVKSLKRQFKTDFNCSLEVYKGNNQIAGDEIKLLDLAKENYAGGELEIGARSRVGNVENYFKDSFGIKVQIKNSENTKLADNDMTLTQAGKM